MEKEKITKAVSLKWSDFMPTQQSFVNIFYLLLTFPLGLAYFIFLVVCLSVGLSLSFIILGILLLAGVFMVIIGIGHFEIFLSNSLLKTQIVKKPVDLTKKGLWEKFKFYLGDVGSWKIMAYVFLKFPIGIFSFVVVVTLYSIAISAILVPIQLFFVELTPIILAQVIINFVMGVALFIAAFQITDSIAYGLAKLSEFLLSDTKVIAEQVKLPEPEKQV